MKKKISLLVILIISLFIVTACDEQSNNNTQENNNYNNNQSSNNKEVVVSGEMKHKTCTRSAEIDGNAEVELNYDIYYTGENINKLISKEKIISNDKDILDEYENAYKTIAGYYEGLKYYDQVVTRTNTEVFNKITIDYDNINIRQLLDIEGEEDNIVENGKAKLNLYLDLLKQFGGTCEDVE